MSSPDLCVFFHGPWGLLIQNGALVAATPAILIGPWAHQYSFCEGNGPRAPLPPGCYQLSLGAGAPTSLFQKQDPMQVTVLAPGALVSDLAYIVVNLPNAGVGYGMSFYQVGLVGNSTPQIAGTHLPEALVLYYHGAAPEAALQFPTGSNGSWSAPADAGRIELHLFGQSPNETLAPKPSHFACMARVFGLDLDFAPAPAPTPVIPQPPLPPGVAAPRHKTPLDCGGVLVIEG